MAETIIKTFRYKIKHTAKFTAAANRALEASRFVYNCALEQRILRYKQGKPIGYFEQSKELTEARKDLPRVRGCLRGIQTSALKRLDLAYQAFFRRIRCGETPGFPRFKSRSRCRTVSQTLESRLECPLIGDVLTVPGIGSVRIRLSRPIEGRVKELSITRCADGWYASLVCEIPRPEPLTKTGQDIGIDVGLNQFVTLSNGEKVGNPRFLRRQERALKRSQRALAAKKKGSCNRVKARQRFALQHLKVVNARKDFHHKLSTDFVRRYDSIAVEKLNILSMQSNHRTAGSITDAGWGSFLSMLAYKAENAGRRFVKVDPAYTSQTCSNCGHRQPMPLSVRLFVCEQCAHTLDRDHNAAINIRVRASGPEFTPVESHKAQRSRNRLQQVPDINRD